MAKGPFHTTGYRAQYINWEQLARRGQFSSVGPAGSSGGALCAVNGAPFSRPSLERHAVSLAWLLSVGGTHFHHLLATPAQPHRDLSCWVWGFLPTIPPGVCSILVCSRQLKPLNITLFKTLSFNLYHYA